MNIQGIQKLTLLDYPGKVACTIFTGGCNFRCPFCHNRDLVLGPDMPGPDAPGLTEEEILAFLAKRKGILAGVCITGGEPLLWPDLKDFLIQIRSLGYLVKLDTNGSLPDRLAALAEEGLIDYVAMDIKNGQERYRETAGLPEDFDLAPILDSVSWLIKGRLPYEFRTTVVREFHRPEDMVSIGRLIQGAAQYFLQGFIASDTVICPGLHGLSAEEMEEYRQLVLPYVPAAKLRGV